MAPVPFFTFPQGFFGRLALECLVRKLGNQTLGFVEYIQQPAH